MKYISSMRVKEVVLSFSLIFMFACVAQAFPKASEMPKQQPGAVAVELSGKVIETMDASGYTYVLLEKNMQKIWVAAPNMKVTVGEELNLHSGQQMGPFTSKSLDRTFDKIVFSSGPVAAMATQPAAATSMPAGHPALPSASEMAQSGGNAAGVAPPAELIKSSGTVVETFNAGGYTYLSLEKEGKKSWAAVPPVEVKVGSEVTVRPGMEMGKFTSKTLKRTFENIVFSPGLSIN